MKNYIPFIVFITVWVFLYLCFAFVLWEPNVANWEQGVRGGYTFFSALFAFVLGGICLGAILEGDRK